MFLCERMDHWARQTPNSPAIIFEHETITFLDFQRNVHDVISYLVEEHNVTAGERIAYLGINHPTMLYIVFACAHLGAIFTPFNSRLAEDEYKFLIENAEPSVCFFDKNFEQTAAHLDSENNTLISVAELKKGLTQKQLPQVYQNADDPLLLVYTSGTTGKPKGVLLSQDAVAANIENGNAFYAFKPQQNILITLPLFHVGGLCILLLPALTQGATVYLHSRFDPAATITSLVNDNITTTILVPAQMAAMMAHSSWAGADMSSMSHVVVGSSLIPMSQIEAWHAKEIPVSQIYGATETGPTAIGLPIVHAVSKAGSAGQAAKLCSIEVRRPNHMKCDVGENGDIWVHGPNILSGYWRNKEETDLVLQDGWYNTGDIGHVDDEGFYWIVDRSKDVIISGGENIYPAEIETIALQHPSIAAIAVVGRNDARWGETPVAAVELMPNMTLDEAGLNGFLKGKIAKFKQPKSLEVFGKLPRNGMGKIEKSVLRKMINQKK